MPSEWDSVIVMSPSRRIQLKKKILDETFEGRRRGETWYRQQPGYGRNHSFYLLYFRRAVNQAIGRVIRHINDFGLVCLVDERFERGTEQFSQLSKWIKPAADQQRHR